MNARGNIQGTHQVEAATDMHNRLKLSKIQVSIETIGPKSQPHLNYQVAPRMYEKEKVY